MTPQEKDLVTQLIDRVRRADTSDKDPEADALIRRMVQEKPDAPYVLSQTVLIQDMALGDAQRRIADLERQVAEAKAAAPSRPSSFLGGVLGRDSAGNAGAASVPSSGPWGRPAAAPQPAPSGVWGQPPAAPPPAPPPAYGQGGYGQGGYAQPGYAAPMMGGGGGFLRSAATTAAGIAGGALLFEGIRSMFGGHAGLGGMAAAPGLSETVINNYYDGEPGAGAPEGAQQADAVPADDPGVQYAADEDGDYDADTDVAADDFGGDDSDVV